MKNKLLIILLSLFSLLFVLILLFNTKYYIKKYDYNYSVTLSNLILEIEKEYPQIDKNKLVAILSEDKLKETKLLKEYGIDIETSSISISNQKIINEMIKLDLIVIFIYILIIIAIYVIYTKSINKRLLKITDYVKEINKKNYKLDIISNGENAFSKLQNEIYKTMVMLNELASNSLNDKEQLKESLSDISHQLKTPLTSINIMLDNIIDNPDMEPTTREEFIFDIKRDIMNINFLVQNILKLSMFDANTINFANEPIDIKEIIDETVKNVLILSDLKNIKIDISCDKDISINGDFHWEVEALTNILKNCIEYAYENSTVSITATNNRIYSTISIQNEGKTIDFQDIKHIFERFYRGKRSSKDGVGIGLALAKTIIEKDNGNISVESKNNITEFKIKYFN